MQNETVTCTATTSTTKRRCCNLHTVSRFGDTISHLAKEPFNVVKSNTPYHSFDCMRPERRPQTPVQRSTQRNLALGLNRIFITLPTHVGQDTYVHPNNVLEMIKINPPAEHSGDSVMKFCFMISITFEDNKICANN